MNKEASIALERSIQHWERLAAAKTFSEIFLEGIGMDSCALCAKFYGSFETHCMGCPVSKAAGEIFCRRTPYAKINAYYHEVRELYRRFLVKEWRELAQAELDFLKSLRKPKKTKVEKEEGL